MRPTDNAKPKLPHRGYLYSVMMARSHELTHHGGEPCDCSDDDPTPEKMRRAYDLLRELHSNHEPSNAWWQRVRNLFEE